MQVAAIENGTVIDHIPAEKTYQVARLLDLDHLDAQVTIGYNLPSKKIGRKGIIKIANKYFTDDIRNYEVVEKRTIETPDELHGIVKCNNPKCITNNEPMSTFFTIVDKERGILKCHYCDKEQDMNSVDLV